MFLSQANFGWLWSIFASFWFWLDKSLFGLIGGLYNILMAISRTAILSQAKIADIADRIQMLLGIFMLFKVGFSLITYIVNPDDFSDKSKGIGKLVTNTVISLALLVLVPYIFNIAYRVQAKILEENVLAQLVFGNKSSEGKKGYEYDILSGGEKVQFEIMLPFLQPNVGVDGMEECSVIKNEKGNFNKVCYDVLIGKVDDADKVNVENYRLGVEEGSFGLTFRLETITTKMIDNTDVYLFDYKWPLTTIAGVIVCLLLISFCIDVALRSIKLSFLQLIAPIPIISYMDPKSGKDGLFSKWYKMCFSTYISLFVRLLALFLGIFIITNIDQMVDVVSGTRVVDPIVKVFIIIGVLFFVKQLPKILQDLGVKLDGDGKFNLNPFKKMEEGMFGYKGIKKTATGAAGAAVGLGVGAVGMATHAGKGKALTGMLSGLKDGLSGKKIGEIHKNQVAANARMRDALANGSTFLGRQGERVAGWTGSGGEAAAIEREKQKIQEEIDKEKNAREAIEGRIAPVKQEIADHKRFADSIKALEDRAKSEIQAGNGGSIGQEYLRRMATYERLKTEGRNAVYTDSNGDTWNGDEAIARAQHDANEYLNTTGMKQYLTEASAHTGNFSGNDADKTFDNLRATAEQAGQTIGQTLSNDGNNMHSQFGAQKGEIGNLERSIYEDEQKMATHDSKIKSKNEEMQKITERESRAKANKQGINKS